MLAQALVAAFWLLQATSTVQGNPRVQAILDRAPTPPRGDVALTLLASDQTVRVGEQIDLVTSAWFPRDLLIRLRRPASLRSPTVDGVYTAVQPTATGVAASRLVNGIWYDLYVAHQVLFPLTPGVLEVPGAALSFSVPSGRQYFSEERMFRRTTRPLGITVLPLPPTSGPGGPAAAGLQLAYELSPEPARAGEPIPVDLVLSGAGNVALWPAPALVWPEGTRGYVDRAEDQGRLVRGILQGTKRFRFSVLADSAGSIALPEVRYPYFDLQREAWSEAIARPVVLPVLVPRPSAERRLPPALLVGEPIGVPSWHLPPWLVVLALMAPPTAVLILAWSRLRRRARGEGASTSSSLAALHALIRSRLPEEARGRRDAVVTVLRESGVDPGLSEEVAALYEDLTHARFDPARRVDDDDLERRAGHLLQALPARIALLAILAFLAPALTAQSPTADSLYRVGAYPAAVRAFTHRVAETPDQPSAWYNLGAAAYASGNDGQAAASWLTARRLAPRSGVIRTGWRRIGLRSAELQRAGRVSPVTPPELFVLALIAWAVTWGLVAKGARRRLVFGWLTAAVALAAAAGVLDRWYGRRLAIVTRSAVLREAPHGLAQDIGRLDELQVVRVRDERTGWRLVAARDGRLGWVPRGSVVEVGRLDFEA